MIYKLDSIPKPNPLIPWVRIFGSLSIKQFLQVYDKLGFPFRPDKNVRQIAHDFAIAEQILRHNSTPEKASIDLLGSTYSGDTYKQQRDILFANTFAQLEKIGYAEPIYHWGKQTTDFQNPINVNSFAAMSNLLRMWAVFEHKEQPHSYNDSSDEIEDLVSKWISVYDQSPSKPLDALHLSLISRSMMQSIVMNQEIRRSNLEATLLSINDAPKTKWEEFAYDIIAIGGIWIRLEGNFSINTVMWKELVENLSSDEIRMVEQWALQHKDRFSWLKSLTVPLFYV